MHLNPTNKQIRACYFICLKKECKQSARLESGHPVKVKCKEECLEKCEKKVRDAYKNSFKACAGGCGESSGGGN